MSTLVKLVAFCWQKKIIVIKKEQEIYHRYRTFLVFLFLVFRPDSKLLFPSLFFSFELTSSDIPLSLLPLKWHFKRACCTPGGLKNDYVYAPSPPPPTPPPLKRGRDCLCNESNPIKAGASDDDAGRKSTLFLNKNRLCSMTCGTYKTMKKVSLQ